MATATSSRTSDVYIDHLTILLNKEEFESLPPWLTDNFTILDGGDHIGLSSRIKLIAFQDGTYIELFSWKDTPPSDHPWGIRDPGILDFALSCALPSTAASNRERLIKAIGQENGGGQLGIGYGKLKAGGRQTPAGAQISWETLHPEYFNATKTPDDSFSSHGRLEAPFWCHDKTERNLRTPFDDPKKTAHPSGATGIAQVSIIVPDHLLDEFSQLYQTVTGSHAERATKEKHALTNGSGYLLHTRSPVSADSQQSLWIHSPLDDEEVQWLEKRGIGLAGFSINVTGEGGSSFQKLSDRGTGSRISLVS